MPAASFYAQINLHATESIENVAAGLVGLGAKSDGLYAKLPSALELRLLTTGDIGVNVAAQVHFHNYDNFGYWDCKVDSAVTHVTSAYMLDFAAGAGLDVVSGNPSQNVTQITYSINDDVIRRTGILTANEIPFIYNGNTIQTSNDFWYADISRVMNITHPDGSPTIQFECHDSTTSSSGMIRFKKSYLAGPIASGANIMAIRANGAYMSGTYKTVGEILFKSAEDFYETHYGTNFYINTYTLGAAGTFGTRLMISSAGVTRLQACIAGNVTKDPISLLETTGSFGAPITSTSGNLTLTSAHFSVVITGAHSITLPSANTTTNRIYIIANKSGASRTISTYTLLSGSTSTTIANATSIIIQSNGSVWHQIN